MFAPLASALDMHIICSDNVEVIEIAIALQILQMCLMFKIKHF